jgi:hypothetical protein
MRFSWRRWRLPLVAAATAVAMSVALAGPAFASEPGESGSWSPEWVGNQDLQANGQVSEARNGADLLDVWRGATNNQVWLSWNNGDPFTLGTTQTYNSPTVVPIGTSSFMVFHVGTDNNIYYTLIGDNGSGGWSWPSGRWISVPGQSTNMSVSVAQIGSGSYNLYMVYHANDNTDRVWGTYFDGEGATGWQTPENLAGGLSPSAPAVAFNPATQHMFVVARGEDNTVWMTNDDPGYWVPWTQLYSGPTYLSPSIAATWDGNMLVAYVDESDGNYHPTYRTYDGNGNPTGGWSTDITGWQTVTAVFLSVAAYSIYTILNGLDGVVYWKQAYQG